MLTKPSGEQQMGDAVSASAGTQVTMNCMVSDVHLAEGYLADTCPDKYNDSTKKYDQTVSVDGKVVSRLSTGKSPPTNAPSLFPLSICSAINSICILSFQAKLTHTIDSGVAQGWGTATECQAAACGTYAAHEYINTKIIMDVADPNYADTKGTTGASGDLVTADGGKTWTVDSIKIEGGEFA